MCSALYLTLCASPLEGDISIVGPPAFDYVGCSACYSLRRISWSCPFKGLPCIVGSR